MGMIAAGQISVHQGNIAHFTSRLMKKRPEFSTIEANIQPGLPGW